MVFVDPGRTQPHFIPQQLDISEVLVGLSPSTLQPASQGLPVYTVGDELWAASHLGSSLSASLSSPNFSSGTTLDPGVVALLHTFREADISGSWSLRLSSSNASRTVAVRFVKQNQSLLPFLTGHGFSNRGDLLLNYTMHAGSAYDIQACVLGEEMPNTVQIPIPGAIGTGQVLLRRAGANATVPVQGQLGSPSTSCFELHHPYPYPALISSGLAERD